MPTRSPEPKSVVIGPHVWTIHMSEADWEKYLYEEMKDGGLDDTPTNKLAGFTMIMQSRLVINPDQPFSQKQDTLLHEIMHAICATFAFKDQGVFKGFVGEEKLVSLITPYLLQVFQSNRKVVEYLCQR